MDFHEPKTPLQKLLAKKRGIEAQLGNPSIPEEQKQRARASLEKTEKDIKKAAGREKIRRDRTGFKAEIF